MRVVVLVGDRTSAPSIPRHWSSEHEVSVVELPARLARLRGRRGPVVLDAARWAFPLWVAVSARARRAVRGADLVVAADAAAQPLTWALARTGRVGVAGLDGAAAWLGPEPRA